MIGLFIMEYMTVLGMTMVLLFLDSRYPKWQTILATYSTMALVMAAVAILYYTVGQEAMIRCYTLVAHVPSLLLLLVFSRFRGWQLVFQLLSAILFCTLTQHGAMLAYWLSGGRIWVLVLAYAVLTIASIWFLVRILRPLFLQTLLELRGGWWLICLVMSAYYIIVVYLIPDYMGATLSSTVLKSAVSLLMVGFYYVLMFLFSVTLRGMESRYSAQLYTLHLSALRSRMEAVRVSEDAIRTERHDLRHRLQAVAELVARGNTKAALDFLDAAQKRLDEQKEIRWCRPPVLDAVFSSYFDEAHGCDIPVEAKISLPDILPVDEGELAVVLANALENAIHANLALPREQRQIRCKMVGMPGIMLEISNPCREKVAFDEQGLPVTHREGHGVGVHSIAAFCQKHGAVYQFTLSDGWFRLRLVL